MFSSNKILTMAHNAALSNVQGLLSGIAASTAACSPLSSKHDVGPTLTKSGDFIYIKHEVISPGARAPHVHVILLCLLWCCPLVAVFCSSTVV